jgi:hypothetical protein
MIVLGWAGQQLLLCLTVMSGAGGEWQGQHELPLTVISACFYGGSNCCTLLLPVIPCKFNGCNQLQWTAADCDRSTCAQLLLADTTDP